MVKSCHCQAVKVNDNDISVKFNKSNITVLEAKS